MSILKNENIKDSFKNAANGLAYAWKTQKNMKFHILFASFAIVLGILLPLSILEWVLLSVSIFGVITAELFNTAIEILIDFVESKKSIYVKLVKDVAASAVLLFVIGAIIVGCIIFIPKILMLIGVL